MIPLSIPNISGNEWKYVKDCLDTGWVSSAGEYVNKFEEVIRNYTDSNMLACMNASSWFADFKTYRKMSLPMILL